MNKWIKRLAITIVSIAVILGGAWTFRTPIMLTAINYMAKERTPVGPHQEVTWATGEDPAGRPAGKRPPNIVLILADDLGFNDLTFNGGGVAGGAVPTPHIDSIGRDGATFMNGYAANATCAPSRAALMSGRYGTRFGYEFTPTPPGMIDVISMMPRDDGREQRAIMHNPETTLPFEQMGMPASEISLAEVLKTQGYHNVHIGKWHLGHANGMAANEQGFDESLLMAGGLYLPEESPDVVNAKQDFDPIDKFLWASMLFAAKFNDGPAFEPKGYLTDYYTDEAVKVIEANKDRPFFLYLAHWAPHNPLQASKEDYEALDDIDLHRERVYGGMIRGLDRGVGRVLQALKDNGLDENTIVIFTSDNGGAGYIGLPDVNAPFRGWKISLFEGGIHVPYFVKWPGKVPAGTIVNDPVHHFDIYATAAAAAGAALPTDRKMDGVDLVPHTRGEAAGVPHEKLFWRSGASQSALVNGWKLNVSTPNNGVWLYDLKNDPSEQNNLAEARPDKLAELQAALAEWNAEQAEPRWPAQISTPINIDRDLSQPDQEGDEFIYWSN
ncbi:MAG: sulfatase-like hydrolase/transferase [Alphaproteobacteria bacterium]